jgi:small-conductance mechanosensitive channel
MTRLAGIDIPAPPELVVPIYLVALLGVATLISGLLRRLTTRWLAGVGERGGGERAAEIPQLGVPIATAVLVGGVLLALPEISLPARLGRWLNDALVIAFVFACALGLARIAVAAVTEYGARHPSFKPALGVGRGIVRMVIAVLSVITALQTLGVPVAPLLTTLGVGSLAVALALQDTLANFFAGLYLLADRPVGAGDYIKIHDGEEGYVETIGWRSSRLRTGKGSIVIVPNQKLSQAILINYYRPTAAVIMTVALTVAAGADSSVVEACFADELARATREVEELKGSKPLARLVDVSDAGQVWNCIFEVPSFEAQGLAGHELRKRLLARLARERIALGLPGRIVRQAGGENPEGARSAPPDAPRS